MVLFPPPFYLFLISQTSYRTYKIISSYELTLPVMETIFLVDLNFMCTKMSLNDFYALYLLDFEALASVLLLPLMWPV